MDLKELAWRRRPYPQPAHPTVPKHPVKRRANSGVRVKHLPFGAARKRPASRQIRRSPEEVAARVIDCRGRSSRRGVVEIYSRASRSGPLDVELIEGIGRPDAAGPGACYANLFVC